MDNTFTITGEPQVKRKYDLTNYEFIEASMQVFFRLYIPVERIAESPLITDAVFRLLNDMMLNNCTLQGIRAKAPEVAHLNPETIFLGLPNELPEGVSLEIFKIGIAYGRTLKVKGTRGSMTPRFSLSFNVPNVPLHEFMGAFWKMARENVKYLVQKERGQSEVAQTIFLGYPDFDAFAAMPTSALVSLPIVVTEDLVVEAI